MGPSRNGADESRAQVEAVRRERTASAPRAAYPRCSSMTGNGASGRSPDRLGLTERAGIAGAFRAGGRPREIRPCEKRNGARERTPGRRNGRVAGYWQTQALFWPCSHIHAAA
jgi:hypothetical protein